jgi:hypothetical protein
MRKGNHENFAVEAKSVADDRSREEIERANELAELVDLLQDKRVRDLLWRVISLGQPFADQMGANFGMVGHALGRASISKWLMNEVMEASPEAWITMQRESLQRSREAAALAASLAEQRERDARL